MRGADGQMAENTRPTTTASLGRQPHRVHILVRRSRVGRSRCSSRWSPHTPLVCCRTRPGRRLRGHRGVRPWASPGRVREAGLSFQAQAQPLSGEPTPARPRKHGARGEPAAPWMGSHGLHPGPHSVLPEEGLLCVTQRQTEPPIEVWTETPPCGTRSVVPFQPRAVIVPEPYDRCHSVEAGTRRARHT